MDHYYDADVIDDAQQGGVASSVVNAVSDIDSLRSEVEECNSVSDLRSVVDRYVGCALRHGARNTVFSRGTAKSRIVFVGEAPGEQEDLRGIPFCGKSGFLLDNMIKYLGFSSDDVYITNTVFWRPEGNRAPTADEYESCLPIVERHIYLLNPLILVLLGATASRLLGHNAQAIRVVRGKVWYYCNRFMTDSVSTIVTYHPSYLLRQPSQKREALKDLVLVKETYQTLLKQQVGLED